ncbi:SAM-dependent methyltransferase [Kitasatospora sp. NPDC056731]|uniref:SAM-dependent methyltransferase n=1 Tax=Kitasatospora sp. NPDC056731 TaxID=3155422 RepID=UPI003429A2AF
MGSKREIDVTVPSSARIYDVLAGGSLNFDADRAAAECLRERVPDIDALALANRSFLHRAVRALAAEYGIRQFLDCGSGQPMTLNVHQIVQAVDPRSRVVYVDNDPIVIAYGRESLDENDRTAMLNADMTDTEGIFEHPAVKELLRPDEPTAVLFVASLECLPDSAQPRSVVRRIVERLPPGSFVVISHAVSGDPQLRGDVTRIMAEQTGELWGRVREQWEVDAYFDGLAFEQPGLVDVADWRPESALQQALRSSQWQQYGGIARVPHPQSAD